MHKKSAYHSRDEIKNINYICGKRKLTMPMSSDAKFALSLIRDSYIKIYIKASCMHFHFKCGYNNLLSDKSSVFFSDNGALIPNLV